MCVCNSLCSPLMHAILIIEILIRYIHGDAIQRHQSNMGETSARIIIMFDSSTYHQYIYTQVDDNAVNGESLHTWDLHLTSVQVILDEYHHSMTVSE